MKFFFYGWLLPVGFVWAWYLMSYNDINLGFHFLSREMHDFVFAVYGHILGIDPATIPPLLLRAFFVDTGFIMLFIAFRKRRQIKAAWQNYRAGGSVAAAANAASDGDDYITNDQAMGPADQARLAG